MPPHSKLHGVSEVGIHSICHILLSQQPALSLLLLLGKTTRGSCLITTPVFVHVPTPPREDDGEFEGEAKGTGDGA